MKTESKIIQNAVLLEEYRKLLQEVDAVEALPLLISGNSMSPFLIHGRDTVYLSRLERPVRRGDMLLYQRRNGSYVLHRVYAVKPEGFTMVGDAQTVLEKGIEPDQVIAIVTQVVRKNTIITPECFWWKFFERVWIRMIPFRNFFCAAYARVKHFVR